MRTDRNRNPAAFTTDVAKAGGLILGTDYEVGDPFTVGTLTLHTAKLLLNPIELTIRVIDNATFYTKGGAPRWNYIAIPKFVWDALPRETKVAVIGWMYNREQGTEMKGLFNGPTS